MDFKFVLLMNYCGWFGLIPIIISCLKGISDGEVKYKILIRCSHIKVPSWRDKQLTWVICFDCLKYLLACYIGFTYFKRRDSNGWVISRIFNMDEIYKYHNTYILYPDVNSGLSSSEAEVTDVKNTWKLKYSLLG